MEQNQINHELNGYKFSFNRKNPYQLNANQKVQTVQQGYKMTEGLQIHKKGQNAKHELNQSNKPASKDRNKVLPYSSAQSSSGLKNTKSMFYKKPEPEKNKVLMDLYLRKTRFNNSKLPIGQSNSTTNNKKSNNSKFNSFQKQQFPYSNEQNMAIKLSFNDNSFLCGMVNGSILTETKEVRNQQNQEENYHDDSNLQYKQEPFLPYIQNISTQHEIPIIVTKRDTTALKIQEQDPSQLSLESHRQSVNKKPIQLSSSLEYTHNSVSRIPPTSKKPPLSNTHNKNSKPNKIFRNFSQHKFSPYLISSPKGKQKSGTAPITTDPKNDHSKHLMKLYPSTSGIDPMLTIQTTSAKKHKQKNLKIKTQISQHSRFQSKKIHHNLQLNLSNFTELNHSVLKNHQNQHNQLLEPLKLQNLKLANQELTGKKHLGLMGHIKYKSPRMILSSRNQLFKAKNQGPKIKLFTEEQEGKIIKQFYSLQKDKAQTPQE